MAPRPATSLSAVSRALVLNASYEPLSVVSDRRAAVLVLTDKAEVVADTGAVLHAADVEVPVPSVVRLRYFVRVPFERRAALNRRAVFARDDHACQYCGRPADSLDHIVPRSRGGEHVWENVVAACRPCNVAKRDRLLEDSGMRLRRPPRAPRRLSWLLVAVGSIPEPWMPYVDAA